MNSIEYFVVIAFGIQALLMLFDEFYFHWRRTVPKFERIGHPIDTFFVLLCYCVVAFANLHNNSAVFYLLLSIISCLCVIKDEAVHKQYCSAPEQYLHALLFLMHPVILFGLFLCWPSMSHTDFSVFAFQSEFLRKIFYMQFFLSFGFFLYQIIYWNFILKEICFEKTRSCE